MVESKTVDDRIGDIDMGGGFGLGKADPNSKPKETFYSSPTKSDGKGMFLETKTKFNKTTEADDKQTVKVVDKQTAYLEFKESRGGEIVKDIEQDRESQKVKKEQIHAISDRCSEFKETIEQLTIELKDMQSRGEDVENDD